jgi:hypothetical protein
MIACSEDRRVTNTTAGSKRSYDHALRSVMTLANCTFIRVRAFCICWMERPVSSTHRCRKR